MEQHVKTRCPHFQLYAEPLDIDHGPNVLAIRRCMLAERLIGFLVQTQNGGLLTLKLTVRISSGREYAIVGPDLEAVTQAACTVKRCEERCTPGYAGHLEHFGGADPNLEEVTCHDPTEERTVGREQGVSARAGKK